MNAPQDLPSLDAAVRQAVAETVISDIHTHLFPPSHGPLLLWGIDEILTYHYLVAELFTVAEADLTYEKFHALPKREQAELVWDRLFIRAGALSEACRGVLTTLNALGLDVGGRDLAAIRRWFGEQSIDDYLPRVFKLAGLDYAVMTNNPFSTEEICHWQADRPVLPCLKTALRIDMLILDWPRAAKAMQAAGYNATIEGTDACFAEARRFLADWAKRINPLYFAASLPNDFVYPSKDSSARVLREVVLPSLCELNLPLAMMIGVRRAVNPPLGDGGDGVGVASPQAVQYLCAEFPQCKFMATFLSRDNQHEAAVLARKFRNLHLFGCWWFCNNPSIIDEISRMRVELLGTAFTAQHSDARVLDQLIYKWSHSRSVLADVLADKYAALFATGWRPTECEIRRDVRMLLGGSFEAFLAK